MTGKSKEGHRQRLRERFLCEEVGSRDTNALLELLLTYAIPRQDVKHIVEELLERFGDLPSVLSASPDELAKCKGIKESSIVLLKAVDAAHRLQRPQDDAKSKKQNEVFPSDIPTTDASDERKKPKQQEFLASAPSVDSANQTDPISTPQVIKKGKRTSVPRPVIQKSIEVAITSKDQHRKFQVSRGYLLELDQMARLLHSLQDMKSSSKITRAALVESTGLADGSIQALVSIGNSIGLINAARQTLTEFGSVIAENDIFIESRATLEWCHYVAAASRRNLIWYEAFNTILTDETPMSQDGWAEYFKKHLSDQYTDKQFAKHVREEVRFIVDAYLERNFRKLELLHLSPDGKLYRRRHARFEPLVLCAMLYDFGAAQGAQLLQVGQLATTPGSPAMVFGVDAATLRQLIGGLHDRGWVRYETTHNLDQIRLKSSMTALELLRAHYEHREPRAVATTAAGELF
jgi:hypothetical protein